MNALLAGTKKSNLYYLEIHWRTLFDEQKKRWISRVEWKYLKVENKNILLCPYLVIKWYKLMNGSLRCTSRCCRWWRCCRRWRMLWKRHDDGSVTHRRHQNLVLDSGMVLNSKHRRGKSDKKRFIYSSFRAGSYDKILGASRHFFCHMFNSKKILLTSWP